jgi:hypothetical protein
MNLWSIHHSRWWIVTPYIYTHTYGTAILSICWARIGVKQTLKNHGKNHIRRSDWSPNRWRRWDFDRAQPRRWFIRFVFDLLCVPWPSDVCSFYMRCESLFHLQRGCRSGVWDRWHVRPRRATNWNQKLSIVRMPWTIIFSHLHAEQIPCIN